MEYSHSKKGFYNQSIHGATIPPDAVEITSEEHAILLAGQSAGKTIVADASGRPYLADPAPPTQAQIIAHYESALDAHLDAVAQSRRYVDRKSFALRAGYSGPYQTEGIAFAQWMDACNVQAYALLQSVIAGHTPLPTIAEMLAGLPEFSI